MGTTKKDRDGMKEKSSWYNWPWSIRIYTDYWILY